MGKYKEHPKYNVVSIRISDEEKEILDEMSKQDRISITSLMRMAISNYTSFRAVSANHANASIL